jgi:hypothetical protein
VIAICNPSKEETALQPRFPRHQEEAGSNKKAVPWSGFTSTYPQSKMVDQGFSASFLHRSKFAIFNFY